VSNPVVVYTDASVDPEKGVGGLAVLGLVQTKGGGKFAASLSLPVADSTLAEVMAVKLALEVVLLTLGPGTQVTLFCDNESVVEHLRDGKRNGRRSCKDFKDLCVRVRV
jgi:ribonuclease HI